VSRLSRLQLASVFQVKMVGRLFRKLGEVCASHPWEVIVTTLTLTVCMLTVDQRPVGLPSDPYKDCDWRNNCVGLEVQYILCSYAEGTRWKAKLFAAWPNVCSMRMGCNGVLVTVSSTPRIPECSCNHCHAASYHTCAHTLPRDQIYNHAVCLFSFNII
jgi:hypothetical protein